MKRVSIKIAMAAIMIAAGTLGLQAQRGMGYGNRGNGTGICIYSNLMTAEQQAIRLDLCAAHQANMAALREELLATPNLADRLAVQKKMVGLRDTHQAEVKTQLSSLGIPVNTAGRRGMGPRGARRGIQFNGAGTCLGIGAGNRFGKK